MDRVSTFGTTGFMMGQAGRLQSLYAEQTRQSSSGLKSETYSGIAGDSQKLLSFESSYSRITSQTAAAKAVDGELTSVSDSLASMGTVINKAMTDLSAALSGNVNNIANSTLVNAQQSLASIVGLLNTKYQGSYLFSGTYSNTAPVDTTDPSYTPTAAPATASTAYYQGNNTLKTVQLSDSVSMDYGVTADNPAFEKIVRAFSLVVANPADQNTLKSAFDLLKQGADGIADLQSTVGSNSALVETQITMHTATLDHLNESISDLKNVDAATVAVQMSQTEVQIQASYSSLAKLLSLKLTDYLK